MRVPHCSELSELPTSEIICTFVKDILASTSESQQDWNLNNDILVDSF